VTANTTKQNVPGETPRRWITNKITQDPVIVLEESSVTTAPDINYEGIQIDFHEGFMVQIVGEGTVILYGRLREDLPWLPFDTLVIAPGDGGTLKNYWGLPLIAARVSAISTPSIKVVVM
jgi:hypothetical protein